MTTLVRGSAEVDGYPQSAASTVAAGLQSTAARARVRRTDDDVRITTDSSCDGVGTGAQSNPRAGVGKRTLAARN
jgi:hypothetical protein